MIHDDILTQAGAITVALDLACEVESQDVEDFQFVRSQVAGRGDVPERQLDERALAAMIEGEIAAVMRLDPCDFDAAFVRNLANKFALRCYQIIDANILNVNRERVAVAAVDRALREVAKSTPGLREVLPIPEGKRGTLKVHQGIEIDASERVKWLDCGALLDLPEAELIALAGSPGSGKSTVAISYLAQLTARGMNCLALCDEDSPASIMRRFLANGGSAERLWLSELELHGTNGANQFGSLRDFQAILDVIDEHDVKFLLVDPVGSFLGRADGNSDSAVRNMLRPLASQCRARGCTLLFVAHTGKSRGDKTLAGNMLGSVAFSAKPRLVMTILPHPDNESLRIVGVCKNNIDSDEWPMPDDQRHFWFELRGKELRIADNGTVGMSLVDVDRIHQERLRGGGSRRESPCQDEASQWLTELLSGGSVEGERVKQAAMRDGQAWRTVCRVKDKLSVKSMKVGSQWFWTMPANEVCQVVHGKLENSGVGKLENSTLPTVKNEVCHGTLGNLDPLAQQPCATDAQSGDTLPLPLEMTPPDISARIHEFRRSHPNSGDNYGTYLTWCATRHLSSASFAAFNRQDRD